MKTIKYKIIVFLLIVTNCSLFAQYNGGDADGSTLETISVTSCTIPPSFYSYFGGNSDGAAVDNLENTICPFSNNFYPYFGGNADGASVDTLEATICGFPPQFYTYFGGDSDGSTVDKTAPVCPTQPPVADFTASATSVCVDQSVTFTDASTNIPSAWTWTLPGGTPNSSTVQNPVVVYSTPGTYAVTLQSVNYNGSDIKSLTGFITVTAYPTVTSTTPAARCDAGTITLNATASAGALSWFADSTGGTALATGTSFVTPSLSTTTTYYVETVNNTCSSARTAVIATVNITPSITATTPASRCGIGTLTLSATSSAGNTVWYAAATGGTALATANSFMTPFLNVPTTYYVEATNGTCSSARTAVIATVNVTPIITSTTPVSQCGTGTATLSAVANSGNLNWYANASGGTSLATGTSFITPSLSANTTYYVEASNGTCLSSRVAVAVTILTLPIITSSGNLIKVCDSGIATLRAIPDANSVVTWYANPTGGNALSTGNIFETPVISTSTTYYAEATRNGCASATRTPVLAVVNVTPTITSTTPGSGCGAGSASLSATANFGTILWYSSQQGGLLLATGPSYSPPTGGTATYYVAASLNNCTSVPIPVTSTINFLQSITSTVPASRCGAGTVTLSATATGGTINWYSTPNGGVSLATGNTFTTPNLSASTTYYLGITAGACVSSRVGIIATINSPTEIVAVGSNGRCNAGTVTLTALPSAGTAVWYAAATGGTALATSNSFTTPSISITTSYFVEAVNGSCSSGTRTEVIATINASPTITATTPTTICGGDTFTITATASAGNLAWYNVPTGGTVQGTGSSFSLSNWATNTTFYVQATDGTCQSGRIPVVVTVNQKPLNQSANSAARCGAGSVALSATYTNGTINWYDAASGGNIVFTGSNFATPSLSATTTYYVEGVNGTCISTIRTAITATINAVPSVSSTTPASRCGTGTLTLSAASSIGTLVWYNLPTGGTALATGTSFSPNISATTTYYVEATNGTCTSTRIAVTATIDNLQAITATTPATRCDAGSVTLSATASGGTLNWYANASGGTSLATGSSFATPSISATTTYYVAVSNGACTSARIVVTATITNQSAPTGTANQSFCSNETVGQLVTNGTNINWYDSSTSNTVLPNNTLLVSGSTYYATQTVSGCESTTRLAVTVQTGNCLGDETFSKLVGLKLYPNPVIDVLNVSYTDKISAIEIISILGQTIENNTINANETQIDMSRLSSGSYLIKVIADDKSEIFKVIKK